MPNWGLRHMGWQQLHMPIPIPRMSSRQHDGVVICIVFFYEFHNSVDNAVADEPGCECFFLNRGLVRFCVIVLYQSGCLCQFGIRNLPKRKTKKFHIMVHTKRHIVTWLWMYSSKLSSSKLGAKLWASVNSSIVSIIQINSRCSHY